jgi:DNA repair exonuclease SbcCD ATPase subunit
MATSGEKHSFSIMADPTPQSTAPYSINPIQWPSQWQDDMEFLPTAPKQQSHAMDKSSTAWMDFSRDVMVPGLGSMSTLSATSSTGFKMQQREEDSAYNARAPYEEEKRIAAPKLQFPSQRGYTKSHSKPEMMGNLKQMKSRLESEKAKLERDLLFMQNQLGHADHEAHKKPVPKDTRESDVMTVSTTTTSGTTYVAEDRTARSLHDQAEDLRQAVLEQSNELSTFQTKDKASTVSVSTSDAETSKDETVVPETTSETSETSKDETVVACTKAAANKPTRTTNGIDLLELQKALADCQSSLDSQSHQKVSLPKPSSQQYEAKSSENQEKKSVTSSPVTSKTATGAMDTLEAKKTTLKFDLAALTRKSKSARGELMALAKELKFDLPVGSNAKSFAPASGLQDLPIDKQTLKRIEELLQQVQQHERTIKELKEEKRRLSRECEEMKAQAKEHRETVTCLATHLDETSNREAMLQRELEEAKSKNYSVKSNIAGADKRVKEAEEKLLKYSKELEASGVLIGVLGVKLENQNRLIQNLNAKQENLSLERDVMKRQVEEQSQTLDTLESQLEEAGSRECFLRKELANAKDQAESVRHALENAVPHERVMELEALVDQYKEEVLEAREEIQVITEENNELRGINCEVGERIMNQAEQHQQIVARLEAELREAREQEQSVRQLLVELKAAADNAKADVESHRNELREARSVKLAANNDQLKREHELETALEESMLEAASAKDDLAEAFMRIRMLEDELMDFQEYLDGSEAEDEVEEDDDDETQATQETMDEDEETPFASVWKVFSCA